MTNPHRVTLRSGATQAPATESKRSPSPIAIRPGTPGTRAVLSQDASLLPDLLHPDPVLRIDRHQTRFAIGLAFAGRDLRRPLSARARSRAGPPDDLGARVLPGRSLPPELRGRRVPSRARVGNDHPVFATAHLLRILAHPPTDGAVVEHRRGILAELAGSPELRSKIESLYVLLCTFRGQLEGINGVGKWDVEPASARHPQAREGRVRRSDGGFSLDSRAIGLRRLAAFADRIRAGEPYASLRDLLRYDENLATLGLKIGVGADGRIRGFEIVSRSRTSNPFVSSPCGGAGRTIGAFLQWLWLRRRRYGAAHRGRVRWAA